MKINGVTISLENRKLGPIPSVSLMPGKGFSCGRACGKLLCEGKCYAKNMFRYTSVKKTWMANWEVWQRKPVDYAAAIYEFLTDYEPRKFRWHVGGDIPSRDYFAMMISTAMAFPQTEFLAFTKAYRFLPPLEVDPELKAPNLALVVSRWPGMLISATGNDGTWNRSFAQAWMKPHEPVKGYEIPKDAVTCPGSCVTCKRCWSLKPGQSVVFEQH